MKKVSKDENRMFLKELLSKELEKSLKQQIIKNVFEN